MWRLSVAATVFVLMLTVMSLAAEKRLDNEKSIMIISIYNGPGIPEGWIDSTTRPDATDICNQLIANQPKQYANAISRSRCLIKVQE
jgi:hypothetical protein